MSESNEGNESRDARPESDQRSGEKSDVEEEEDAVRPGLGMLSALKEALEETIAEAREKGDLSFDRVKDTVKGALDRAREAAGGARERLDLGRYATVEEVASPGRGLSELQERVDRLEKGASASHDEGLEPGGEP